MATKIGQKRTEPRQPMRRKIKSPPKTGPTSLKAIKDAVKKHPPKRMRNYSPKRQQQINKYRDLIAELRCRGTNKSEYSGKLPAHGTLTDPHHIRNRQGRKLLNPFGIVFLTAEEHRYFQKHMTEENKQMLETIVRPLRLAQGYREEDYK